MDPKLTIRRANVDDVDTIFRLTAQMADRKLMLARSKYKIITMLPSYFVVEVEGEVVASGSCSVLWTDMAEICALAVHDEWQGKGVGKALVDAIIAEGKRLKLPKLITLTYQIEFFKKMGFQIGNKDSFPRKLWRECLECPKLEACDETAMFLDIGDQ
ncbi:MAG: N-acetyltransferase [Spirochaetales bacterium]|nr:N-acetyltransferase [Spirochaetales bacterium]